MLLMPWSFTQPRDKSSKGTKQGRRDQEKTMLADEGLERALLPKKGTGQLKHRYFGL